MDVIIVSKFQKTPRKLSMRGSRLLLAATSMALLLTGAGVAAGYGIHSLKGGDSQTTAQVEQLQHELAQQRAEFESASEAAQRELNALSIKLAELQAESTRINALGARLTKIARLDDGEFNFDEAPALGGPNSTDTGAGHDHDHDHAHDDAVPTSGDLGSAIDTLQQHVSIQGQQLALLESLLSDRELDASLLPTGLPVRTGYASSNYGRRTDPFSGFTSFHQGVDFAGPQGSDILAVADGVVQFSDRMNGYGNIVEVDHGNGYVTRYAHNHKNLVSQGDRVKAGQVIALMGSTGRSSGTHLHFEVWLNGKVVNPNQYLRNARG